MDELRGFCVRMLGEGPSADEAEREARGAASDDRLGSLSGAVRACREREPAAPAASDSDGLAAAVARELRTASAQLTVPQREALALRELLGLPYDELADVMSVAPDSVPGLLAGARLALRAQLRDAPQSPAQCPEHDRALRTIALRQDRQPVPIADDDWLVEHLGHCQECGRAHSAMLEAGACYRAWRPEPAADGGSGAAGPRDPAADGDR
jgi:Sigma-70, region 4